MATVRDENQVSSTSSSWRSATRHRRDRVAFANVVTHVVADVDVAGVVIPRRYAMAPPQLPADTPVLDVVHPFVIGLGPVLRYETDAAAFDGFNCRFGQRFDPYVPLIGQERFDDGATSGRRAES